LGLSKSADGDMTCTGASRSYSVILEIDVCLKDAAQRSSATQSAVRWVIIYGKTKTGGIRGSHRGTPHRSSTCTKTIKSARENQIQFASARGLRHTRGGCVGCGRGKGNTSVIGNPSIRTLQKPIFEII
ncbi:hypothetical protein JI435_403780, partial [Parastagonospora nodorum SN15]